MKSPLTRYRVPPWQCPETISAVPPLSCPVATPSRCYAHYGTRLYSIINLGPTPYPCTPLVDTVSVEGGAADTWPANTERTPISIMVFVLQGGPTPRMFLFGYVSQVDNLWAHTFNRSVLHVDGNMLSRYGKAYHNNTVPSPTDAPLLSRRAIVLS